MTRTPSTPSTTWTKRHSLQDDERGGGGSNLKHRLGEFCWRWAVYGPIRSGSVKFMELCGVGRWSGLGKHGHLGKQCFRNRLRAHHFRKQLWQSCGADKRIGFGPFLMCIDLWQFSPKTFSSRPLWVFGLETHSLHPHQDPLLHREGPVGCELLYAMVDLLTQHLNQSLSCSESRMTQQEALESTLRAGTSFVGVLWSQIFDVPFLTIHTKVIADRQLCCPEHAEAACGLGCLGSHLTVHIADFVAVFQGRKSISCKHDCQDSQMCVGLCRLAE